MRRAAPAKRTPDASCVTRTAIGHAQSLAAARHDFLTTLLAGYTLLPFESRGDTIVGRAEAVTVAEQFIGVDRLTTWSPAGASYATAKVLADSVRAVRR